MTQRNRNSDRAACYRLACAIFSIGLIGIQNGIMAQQPYQATAGTEHADFCLPSIEDSAPISLSDYRGRKLILIHFASW